MVANSPVPESVLTLAVSREGGQVGAQGEGVALGAAPRLGEGVGEKEGEIEGEGAGVAPMAYILCGPVRPT